ncbi:hypothetical protein [Pseudomonas fluorescens]|uniref:Rhs element Vgr protein n=1 Tax=Pseudomonas fluorescens TaxID=294 RepID=A0A5E7BLR7_PSEFL|nr:hypothetical protein [Pseudomonas fluorescens]VVN92400.1 hypothetical protein PS723_01977 [Pseudomonas fluorescens]
MPRQSDLRFTFEPACGAAFKVIEFTLVEGLSQPFKLELTECVLPTRMLIK